MFPPVGAVARERPGEGCEPVREPTSACAPKGCDEAAAAHPSSRTCSENITSVRSAARPPFPSSKNPLCRARLRQSLPASRGASPRSTTRPETIDEILINPTPTRNNEGPLPNRHRPPALISASAARASNRSGQKYRGRPSLCPTIVSVSRCRLQTALPAPVAYPAPGGYSKPSLLSSIPELLASHAWCCTTITARSDSWASARSTAKAPISAGLTANPRRLDGQRPRRRRIPLQQQQHHGSPETSADAVAWQSLPRLPARRPPLWQHWRSFGDTYGTRSRSWHARRPLRGTAYGW